MPTVSERATVGSGDVDLPDPRQGADGALDFSHHTCAASLLVGDSTPPARLGRARRARLSWSSGAARRGRRARLHLRPPDEPTRASSRTDLAKAEAEVCCTFSRHGGDIRGARVLLKPGDTSWRTGRSTGARIPGSRDGCPGCRSRPRFAFTDLATGGAIRPETRVIYAETPANRRWRSIDLGPCALADEVNASRPADRKVHALVDNRSPRRTASGRWSGRGHGHRVPDEKTSAVRTDMGGRGHLREAV